MAFFALFGAWGRDTEFPFDGGVFFDDNIRESGGFGFIWDLNDDGEWGIWDFVEGEVSVRVCADVACFSFDGYGGQNDVEAFDGSDDVSSQDAALGQLDREVSDVSISELKFGRGCGFAGVFAYFDAIIAFGEVGEFKF